MRNVLGLALLSILVSVGFQDSKIDWKRDYASGLKAAQESGKLAVVHFGGEG